MERLLATLKSMVRAYDRLLALSRRKQGHLIKGEVEPLSWLIFFYKMKIQSNPLRNS